MTEPRKHFGRAAWAAFSIVIVLLLSIALLLLRPTTPSVALDESAKLTACRSEALGLVKPSSVSVDLLTQMSNYCYSRVRGEDLLGDFNIRRSNYFKQQFQGAVFLWMVVTITISGVVLAALQLLAAYKLAVAGRGDLNQGGEVTLEEKRLSVKSSVTGLLILTVSFAFFMVFVVWVYPLTETKLLPEGTSQAAPMPFLPGVGVVGPGPQAPPPTTPSLPGSSGAPSSK